MKIPLGTLKGSFLPLVAATVIMAGLPLASAYGAGDAEKGEKVFKKCKSCHSLEDGQNKIGPHLHGLMGRTAGAVEGFNYSDAMAGSGVVWEEETLDAFLTKPKDYMPGTKMTFAGLKKPEDRADVIAYLMEATQ